MKEREREQIEVRIVAFHPNLCCFLSVCGTGLRMNGVEAKAESGSESKMNKAGESSKQRVAVSGAWQWRQALLPRLRGVILLLLHRS